tara:strand:- start:61 stop:411 length:351 start_codon:yes stop_codon:yes gene_type:complete
MMPPTLHLLSFISLQVNVPVLSLKIHSIWQQQIKKQNRRQKINQQIKTCVSNNDDSSDPVFFLYIVGTPKTQRQLLQTVKGAINMLTYLPQISVQGTGSCQCWSVGVRVIPGTSTH